MIYLAEFLSSVSETAYLRMPYKTRCRVLPMPGASRHYTEFKVNCVSSSYGQMLGARAKKMDKYGGYSHRPELVSGERNCPRHTFISAASPRSPGLRCVPRCAPCDQQASAGAPASLSFTFLKLSRPTLLDIATHEENVLHDILWSHDTHTYYYSLSSRQIDF